MSFGPACPICGQFACDCAQNINAKLALALLLTVIVVFLVVAALS